MQWLYSLPHNETENDLAKISPKLFMTDYDRGRPLDYETEWCPAGIIERFEKIKMASKMATPKKSGP